MFFYFVILLLFVCSCCPKLQCMMHVVCMYYRTELIVHSATSLSAAANNSSPGQIRLGPNNTRGYILRCWWRPKCTVHAASCSDYRHHGWSMSPIFSTTACRLSVMVHSVNRTIFCIWHFSMPMSPTQKVHTQANGGSHSQWSTIHTLELERHNKRSHMYIEFIFVTATDAMWQPLTLINR